jgi:hypothetical protein
MPRLSRRPLDSNGNYTLSNVPPGSYVVSAAATGYSSQSQTLTVVSNVATVANFTLSPLPGSISGKVTDRSTGLGISGATVAFTIGSVTTSAITDANGNYAFANVTEGAYSLTASASGYVSQTAAVTVAAGAAVTQNFVLPLLPGVISGQVTNAATASGIGGAMVSYTVSGVTTTATADANGSYTISNVPPGTYNLTAGAAGYTSESRAVTVATNATSSQTSAL